MLAACALTALASAAFSLWCLCSASTWRSCLFCITSGLVLGTVKFIAACSRLVGAVYRIIILVRQRGDQVCWDTVLDWKGPALMPFSAVATSKDDVVAGLHSKQLKKVVLELPGLERGFFSLVCIAPLDNFL